MDPIDCAIDCSVRPKKPFAIEVDQMGRGTGNPHFCFPGNFSKVPAHERSGREGGHEDQSRCRSGKEPGQLCVALAIDGAVTGDRLDQQQPVSLGVVKHHVRHLAM